VVKSPAMRIPISLRRYNITREEFLSQHPEYNKVAIGALVFDKQSGKWRLLILQRASTAKSSPGRWEIPGGKLENETILNDIARELLEKVGMTVIDFIHLVDGEVHCATSLAKLKVACVWFVC
jgi:8-oxo-dGTP pyrophosphatase MutT (NUDIX family)